MVAQVPHGPDGALSPAAPRLLHPIDTDHTRQNCLIRREFRAKPEQLQMITGDGDSMEPLLSRGDRILIDVSRQLPVPPGISVIWDGMGFVAKRIEHVPRSDPPRVVLNSLNPEYDSYERPAEEVRVVGRAVWVSRRL